MKPFTRSNLDLLTEQAVASPRLRQHWNLHQNYQDLCQRLFNAIEPDSYIRPHCHGVAQGVESIFAIRGLMALVSFDDNGNVLQVQKFGAGIHASSPDVMAGFEISPSEWHTVVSMEPGSILLEVKSGPFDPESPKFLAAWAPEEGSEAAFIYLHSLRCRVAHVDATASI